MLQKYNISMESNGNHLSIKEFSVLGRISKRYDELDPAKEDYSLTCEKIYDAKIIREAIKKGNNALITELQSNNFYPVRPCMEIIADRVTELFANQSGILPELFFDDRSLLPVDKKEN